jgi:hypothetical protein
MKFFQFLVIKTLDPDRYLAQNAVSGSVSNDPDPKHCPPPPPPTPQPQMFQYLPKTGPEGGDAVVAAVGGRCLQQYRWTGLHLNQERVKVNVKKQKSTILWRPTNNDCTVRNIIMARFYLCENPRMRCKSIRQSSLRFGVRAKGVSSTTFSL